jgi:hypothetical protein
MVINYTSVFPFRGTPKYTLIGYFGVKIYHLATLNVTERQVPKNVGELDWTQTRQSLMIECLYFQSTLRFSASAE